MEQGLVNGHNGVDHLEILENGLENGDVLENGEANGKMAGDGNGVDIRIKKKAKRLIKQFSKEGVVNGHGGSSVVVPPRSWKNTRRPRNGYGRGLPKKGKINLMYLIPFYSSLM